MYLIELLQNDLTHPKGSTGVVATLKSKMAAASVSSGTEHSVVGEIIEIRDLARARFKLNERYSTAQPRQNTCTSALLPFKFPASGKYDTILDLLATTTPTIHLRTAKALFDVIMHKVYYTK